MVADTETPVSALLKLTQPGRGDFLLESVEGGAARGRYSLIGLDPDLVFRANGRTAEINSAWQVDRAAFVRCEGETLAELRKLVASCRLDVPDALPPALALLVGNMGYETIGLVEDLPVPHADAIGVPDMTFVRPSLLLVFDRLKDELFLVAPLWADTDVAEARARERIEAAAARLAQPVPRPAHAAVPAELTAPSPVLAPGVYGDMVMRAKEYIAAGDIFQVVLAQRFTTPFPLPPIDRSAEHKYELHS